ncbi:MAG: hypothetical protein KDE27_18290 [Planctomycetes bacterium]|nr:hypothetical protein [Planctomycetota bacterium]
MAACGHGQRLGDGRTTVHPELIRVEYGRLADVYGLRRSAEGTTIELVARDVLIGPDIVDERDTGSAKSDGQVVYDFFGSDPDTLQPRLLIPRDVDSAEFESAFAGLDDNVREVAPMVAGSNKPELPFSVVPRNAAIRLSFTAPLGVDDSFFVTRDERGRVTHLRNTEAVQLLRITGDPEQGNTAPLPVRVLVDNNRITLDPVLLGSEGLQYQARNRASGMPESPDRVGANIRIALALEGPLAIPGLRPANGPVGSNNSRRQAIVRDFRSGNREDESADLASGFVRDPLPLRIVGEITMYLERVDRVNSFTHEITVFKDGAAHEIDRGDVFRLLVDSSGVPFATTDVTVDPIDDRGAAGTEHVRVRVRNVPGLERIDPRGLPGYPAEIGARERWLVQNAPKAICVAEFEAGDGGQTYGDDPRLFLSFTPEPLPNLDGTPVAANEYVSPFAGALVRFTKPVAIESVKWAETFFFAMRDLTDPEAMAEFVATRPNNLGGRGMDPAAFHEAKYRTPFLIGARVYDEDSSSTELRLQPSAGFYLDERMRNDAGGVDYRYFLHLIAQTDGGKGITDLSGNAVDLQGADSRFNGSVVVPFTVDTRKNGGTPFFEDNLAVSVVRTFAHRDEDPRPSYFLPEEVPAPGETGLASAYPLEDLFGGFVLVDGRLRARPTSRTRAVADNLNQAPVASQASVLRWCPLRAWDINYNAGNEELVPTSSAGTTFGQGIQNPMNPQGSRLQTVWREIDLSLSRTDPFEFNLDVEQMWWAPFTGTVLTFDEFDRMSLYLGHSEFRPIPCNSNLQALPLLPDSGLRPEFDKNYVWNPAPIGAGAQIESQPSPHPAYVDQGLTIDASTVVYEVNGVNRYLPLPRFQKPYFVFRDETVVEQGGDTGGRARDNGTGNAEPSPYILSPFNNGLGRRWIADTNLGASGIWRNDGFWNDLPNFQLDAVTADNFTGGLVGAIALPLLADFRTYCDSAELPHGNGYVALGTNGWQVALTVQSSPKPNFRVFSGGRGGESPICVGPGGTEWNVAAGGYTLGGVNTPEGDNSLYWIMMDLLKRQTVVTNGFVDLANPHRVPKDFEDSRLGPFWFAGGASEQAGEMVPTFAFEFDPPLSEQPGGTSVVAQFRGASAVDPEPWYWDAWMRNPASTLYTASAGARPGYTTAMRAASRPDARCFPLDPLIAGDAHIRKWDRRNGRNWWSHLYNTTVTGYVEDPNRLVDPAYTEQFDDGRFRPEDMRYVNWRFVMSNNIDVEPSLAPSIDTFALTWRFERRGQ